MDRREYDKIYYQQHKNEILEKRLVNREKNIKYCKEWRIKNKDRRKEYLKEYYDKKKKVLEQTITDELSNKKYKTTVIEGKPFFITDNGEIYSSTRKYKCSRRKNGYSCVTVNYKTFYVHRLVWKTFNGEIPDGYEIDHKNTVRDDNRLDNLRLVSSSENKRNPITIEKYRKSNKNKPHTYEQRMKASMNMKFQKKIKKYHNQLKLMSENLQIKKI